MKLKNKKKPRGLNTIKSTESGIKNALRIIQEGNKAIKQKKTRGFDKFIIKKHPQLAKKLWLKNIADSF